LRLDGKLWNRKDELALALISPPPTLENAFEGRLTLSGIENIQDTCLSLDNELSLLGMA
jgi:hypothetical protein